MFQYYYHQLLQSTLSRSRRIAGALGAGTYFAESSGYSANYVSPNNRAMFFCRVSLGAVRWCVVVVVVVVVGRVVVVRVAVDFLVVAMIIMIMTIILKINNNKQHIIIVVIITK